MGIVQTAIQAMRTIKSTYNLKAQKAEEDAVPTRVQFAVKCADAESRKVLAENQATIELMTRAELHQVVEEVASQKGTIAEVVPGMTVLLLHADTLIDAQAELGRLDKEAQKVDHVSSMQGQTQGVRLGCEFLNLNADATRSLQRYIDQTQKRRRMMALD